MLRYQPLHEDPDTPRGVYLHCAVDNNPSKHLVDMLLRAGAEAAETDGNGDTPLSKFLWMVLAEGRRDNIRRELIVDSLLSLWGSNGMDVDRVNSAGGSIKSYLAWMIRYDGACPARLNLAQTLQAAIEMVPSAAGGVEWEPRPRRIAAEDAAVADDEQRLGPRRSLWT